MKFARLSFLKDYNMKIGGHWINFDIIIEVVY